MRTIALVGVLLLALVVMMAGCASSGEGGEGGFDTRYSLEQQRYVPAEEPQAEQVEQPAEGPETE